MHHDREKYEFSKKNSVMCHVAILELRLSAFYSENNFCKEDVISVKTRCIMTEKKYYHLYFYVENFHHTTEMISVN